MKEPCQICIEWYRTFGPLNMVPCSLCDAPEEEEEEDGTQD